LRTFGGLLTARRAGEAKAKGKLRGVSGVNLHIEGFAGMRRQPCGAALGSAAGLY